MCKIAGCAYTGNAGNVFPPPRISHPHTHHGTCVTHVSWCMSGSLISGFLWSRWRGKRFRHSRRMPNPQFYVSRKRPMLRCLTRMLTHGPWLVLGHSCGPIWSLVWVFLSSKYIFTWLSFGSSHWMDITAARLVPHANVGQNCICIFLNLYDVMVM